MINKPRIKISLIFLLSLPLLIYGQKKELDYEFTRQDTTYFFKGSFIVPAKPECVLEVIFDFEHISKYAMGAKSVEWVRGGEDWYEVTYVYRKYLVFENRSTWLRTLQRQKNRLVFEMISSKNNLPIMPKVLSSTGYYQLKQIKEGCRVEYYQECRLTAGILKGTYINQAKKEAIKFLGVFKKYLENSCD